MMRIDPFNGLTEEESRKRQMELKLEAIHEDFEMRETEKIDRDLLLAEELRQEKEHYSHRLNLYEVTLTRLEQKRRRQKKKMQYQLDIEKGEREKVGQDLVAEREAKENAIQELKKLEKKLEDEEKQREVAINNLRQELFGIVDAVKKEVEAKEDEIATLKGKVNSLEKELNSDTERRQNESRDLLETTKVGTPWKEISREEASSLTMFAPNEIIGEGTEAKGMYQLPFRFLQKFLCSCQKAMERNTLCHQAVECRAEGPPRDQFNFASAAECYLSSAN